MSTRQQGPASVHTLIFSRATRLEHVGDNSPLLDNQTGVLRGYAPHLRIFTNLLFMCEAGRQKHAGV
jgi:hypothetical protein